MAKTKIDEALVRQLAHRGQSIDRLELLGIGPFLDLFHDLGVDRLAASKIQLNHLPPSA